MFAKDVLRILQVSRPTLTKYVKTGIIRVHVMPIGIVGGILVAFIAITVILYLLALLVGVCMVTLSCLACLIVKIYSVLRKLFCPA